MLLSTAKRCFSSPVVPVVRAGRMEGGARCVRQGRAWGGGNNRVAVTVAAAESSLYQYVLYFSYSEYNQTVLDPVFDADHDARISLGQGRRQLAAFQRQSRHLARFHPKQAARPGHA